MAAPVNRGLHGGYFDRAYIPGVGNMAPLIQAVLDAGNRLRYGQTEAERQEDIQSLRAPGVRQASMVQVPSMTQTAEGQFVPSTREEFDPAVAERYTSAYRFGQRFQPPRAIQPTLHAISSGGRKTLASVPVLAKLFGVGEERPELEEAERMGMSRGAFMPNEELVAALSRKRR